MTVVVWSNRAFDDLQRSTDSADVRRRLMDLAENELRYPPQPNGDEGWLQRYDNGLAYRRALARGMPSLESDLRGDVMRIDNAGFPYGELYFVYRELTPAEAHEHGLWGSAGRLIVTRLKIFADLVVELLPEHVSR